MTQEWNRAPRAGGANLSTGETARILVVDSDDDTRTMYREWFQLYGSEIIEAADGREALAEALIRPPALVISEIRLPFIDGYALYEILRRDHATTRVPILVVTSEARPAELKRARMAGASAVLLKPATPEQMLAEAHRLLSATPEFADLHPESARHPDVASPPAGQRRRSKSLPRLSTTTPPVAPPALICPSCDRRLAYRLSHVGGVNDRWPEQWDWFVCPVACGAFEYRHRTRSLRRLLPATELDQGHRRRA